MDVKHKENGDLKEDLAEVMALLNIFRKLNFEFEKKYGFSLIGHDSYMDGEHMSDARKLSPIGEICISERDNPDFNKKVSVDIGGTIFFSLHKIL